MLCRTRGISATLHKDATNPNAFVATKFLGEDLVGLPKSVLYERESSMTVLNHLFSQYNCCCDLLASFVIDANCRFLCCKDNCISPQRTLVRRKHYHLDNLFLNFSSANEINAVRYANVIMNINPRIDEKD